MKIPYKYTPIGFNYVMLNIPFIWRGKIGYTGKLKGVNQRAESVSEAAPGILIPIMVCVLPLPWFIEQGVLKLLSPTRSRYYKGDGHTEAVNLAGVAAAWIIYACVWLMYIEIAYQYDLSPVGAVWVINKFAIVVKIICNKFAILV